MPMMYARSWSATIAEYLPSGNVQTRRPVRASTANVTRRPSFA
jgi:hypothetical protein